MFSRSITELRPWTEDGMFDNIRASSFRDGYGEFDQSLTAVARALFARRLPEDEKFSIRLENVGCGDTPAESLEPDLNSIVVNVTDGVSDNVDGLTNTIIIAQYRDAKDEDVDAVINAGEDLFIPHHPGWAIHTKAEFFLRKEMKVRILFNKEHKAAFVITGRLTMPHWHLIGSMLPTYVPALFDTIPVEDDEYTVLKSLALHGSATFITAITALEAKYDIRSKKIAAMIGGFEIRERENQVARVDNEIRQIENNMRDLMERYKGLVMQKDDANVRRAGLKYIINDTSDDDTLVKFFQANECLDVVSVRGSVISFIVRTYYDSFNQDEYERFRENNAWYSELMPRSEPFRVMENCRKVMDAMFISRKIRLRMCALFHLDIRGEVSTTTNYSFPPNCENYIPNYHLNQHDCFGDNRPHINAYLDKGDTIGAINACIASAKAVNISESGATFNPMMKQVFESTKECFELPDGTCVTPVKALEWLNAEEGGSKNETDTTDA